ncbi:MAG: ABC transporter permease [Verrucomicrobia bacterium]|nr:ABC transporter permease [Verrucomicrobiota bacterium]
MNPVAQSVPAASCSSVPLPARTPGGTPGQLAGEDARATSSPVGFWGLMREISFRGILPPSDGERVGGRPGAGNLCVRRLGWWCHVALAAHPTQNLFDRSPRRIYFRSVQKAAASVAALPPEHSVARLPRAYFAFVGRKILRLIETIQGLGAFALITLVVTFTKFNVAARVVHPLIRIQITRAGVRLIPMVAFLAAALGLVIVGQTVLLLARVGVEQLLGTIMVTVVVRELGPIVAALLVMARMGTATVIELGTTRALGEVEALEALGIDPIHFLVVPRVLGMGFAIFSLTVYLIIGALFSGYVFAFLQDANLSPAEYCRLLASALNWWDFILLALKTFSFGVIIAIVTCYHGLAQPLRLEEVSNATVSAVAQCVIACVLLDALFIIVYLLV